jgi:hypothetical protein
MAEILDQVVCTTAGEYLGELQAETGFNLISLCLLQILVKD